MKRKKSKWFPSMSHPKKRKLKSVQKKMPKGKSRIRKAKKPDRFGGKEWILEWKW